MNPPIRISPDDVKKYNETIRIDYSSEITKVLYRKILKVPGIVRGTTVSFSPKLILMTKTGEQVSSTNMILFGVKIQIKEGSLYYNAGFSESIDFYTRFFSLLNLIGIPFEIPNKNHIEIILEDKNQEIRFAPSEKAVRFGTDTDPVVISSDDLRNIEEHLNVLWDNYSFKLKQMGDAYKFLGFARYHNFNSDPLLSFINGFIFLESIVNDIWTKLMKEKLDGKIPDNDKDWTLSIRTDLLFFSGVLSKPQKEMIHRLRKKRNAVFHADPNQERRLITKEDSENCITVSLDLFFNSLQIKQKSFLNIDKDIRKIVHRCKFQKNEEK